MPGASSTSRVTWRAWLAEVPGRVRACWRLKALLAVVMTLMFCGPYFLLGHYPQFPVRELPLTWVDRAIGYHPYEWVWVYQSEYAAVNLIPWLSRTREELARYARGFGALSLVSFAVFVFFPVRAPKPEVNDATGMYWLLLQYDVPLNSIPSLHAGLVVCTFCYGRRLFGGALPPGLGPACAAWALFILFSTMATKEHYFVDIVAGTALGFAAHAWAWRRARPGVVSVGLPPLREGS